MKKTSRRGFLKRLGAAASGLALGGEGTLSRDSRSARVTSERTDGSSTLTALAEVVLPARALGTAGLGVAVESFRRWQDGLQPGAELDHAYLWTDQLQYGPEDARPLWDAQLAALERRAEEEAARPFAELPVSERRRLLARELPDDLSEGMPHASEAGHVAVALACWYFATPAANDLCYGARIGRHACRGLPTAPQEPLPFLAGEEAEDGP